MLLHLIFYFIHAYFKIINIYTVCLWNTLKLFTLTIFDLWTDTDLN